MGPRADRRPLPRRPGRRAALALGAPAPPRLVRNSPHPVQAASGAGKRVLQRPLKLSLDLEEFQAQALGLDRHGVIGGQAGRVCLIDDLGRGVRPLGDGVDGLLQDFPHSLLLRRRMLARADDGRITCIGGVKRSWPQLERSTWR